MKAKTAALASIVEKCPYPEGSNDRAFWLGGFLMGGQLAYHTHHVEGDDKGEAEGADNTDA